MTISWHEALPQSLLKALYRRICDGNEEAYERTVINPAQRSDISLRNFATQLHVSQKTTRRMLDSFSDRVPLRLERGIVVIEKISGRKLKNALHSRPKTAASLRSASGFGCAIGHLQIRAKVKTIPVARSPAFPYAENGVCRRRRKTILPTRREPARSRVSSASCGSYRART